MKRIILSLLISALFLLNISFVRAEEQPVIQSYDFDLRFHLNIEEYPFREQKYIQGYQELLDMLELKGNVAWCDEKKSLDIHFEIIPVTNPEAAIQFRIYGLQDFMCMTSPLLGEEPLFLNNYGVMKFAGFVWQSIKIPLPYVVLLNPYVTMRSLKNEVDAWRKVIPTISDKQKITVKQLKKVSDTWKDQLQHDSLLENWLYGLYAMLPDTITVETALEALPDLLVKLAKGKDLRIKGKDGVLSCVTAANQTIFEEIREENSYAFELKLPENDEPYLPYFYYDEKQQEGTKAYHLILSWNRNQGTEEENRLESLLNIGISANGIPSSWPAKAEISVTASSGGYILPANDVKIRIHSKENGNFQLETYRSFDDKGGGPLFVCSGSVTPAEYNGEMEYNYDELSSHPALFVTSYGELSDLMNRISKPVMKGMLDFLYEMPVSSCQSIMDDLENYQVLELIMNGLR